MGEIILTFDWDGKTVKKETKGFVGSDCVKNTKFVEDALGVVSERRFKSEYYEEGENEKTKSKTRN